MLMLQCNGCKTQVFTDKGHINGGPPDSQLACDCCPQDHDHAGLGCRPITIMMLPGSVALQGA